MGTSVVGIDIGCTSIRAVEVEDPAKARPTLVRYHEVALPDGAVSRGEVIEPNTVSASLKMLWSQAGFKSKNVVLGMGNQRVLVRDLSVPKMPMERIRESLPFQVQDLLPVPVADAILDFYPISESAGEVGTTLNGLLIAVVKDAVLGNVKAAQLAGLTTFEVDLIPFALARVLLTRSNRPGTVALIDIGANTTSVIIARDGIPQFVRIIPAGGADLTEALRSALEIDANEAEGLKRSLGLATQVNTADEHQAVQIIYQSTSDLLNSLRNTVNYYINTRQSHPVGEIVITGGGAQLSGLAEALGEMTRLPVSQGDPFTSIALSRNLSADDLRLRRSTLGVALGLAIGSAA